MICRIVLGQQFAGVVEYQFAGHQHKPVDKQATLLLSAGVSTDSVESMITDFNKGRMQNPDLGKAVLHTSLSFNPDDSARLDDKLMRAVAWGYIQKMELDKTQFIVVRHRDRPGHEHLHIVTNRVDDDGRTIKNGHNFYRAQKAIKELVEEFQLTPVRGQRVEQQRPESMTEYERTKHTLRSIINQELTTATSAAELQQGLRKRGVTWEHVHSEEGKVKGCRFSLDKVTTSGSRLGSSYSLPAITTRLQENYEQRNQALEQKWQHAYQRELENVQLGNFVRERSNALLDKLHFILNENGPAQQRLTKALSLPEIGINGNVKQKLEEQLSVQQVHANRVAEIQQEKEQLANTAKGILGFKWGSKAQEAQAKLRIWDNPELAVTDEQKQWAEKARFAQGPEPSIEFRPLDFVSSLTPEPTLAQYARDQERDRPYFREIVLDISQAKQPLSIKYNLSGFGEQFAYHEPIRDSPPSITYDARNAGNLPELARELIRLRDEKNVGIKFINEEHKQEVNNALAARAAHKLQTPLKSKDIEIDLGR